MLSALLLSLAVAAPPAAQRSSGTASSLPISGGLGVQIDTTRWYIDFSVELMARSVRQRRIALTADYYMLSMGSADIGLELTYWKLGFRRRTVTIDDTEYLTQRQGRAVMAGAVIRRPGPRHTVLTGAILAGWYDHRIDSMTTVGDEWQFQPIAGDNASIGGVRFGVKFPEVVRRISADGSVRHFRLWGTHPWWVPRSEWSGEVALDVRTFSVRKKAIYVGALARFGPRGPGLVTDKTFGLRMKWKLR